MSGYGKLDVRVNVVVCGDRSSRTQTNRRTRSRTQTRTYAIHYRAARGATRSS